MSMSLTSISQNYYIDLFMKMHRYYLYRIYQVFKSNISHSHNNDIHYINIGAMICKNPPFTSLHP